jgi:hypothetical protein
MAKRDKEQTEAQKSAIEVKAGNIAKQVAKKQVRRKAKRKMAKVVAKHKAKMAEVKG